MREHYDERAATGPPPEKRDAFVEQAVAEITARQRTLDGEPAGLSFGERQPLAPSALPEEQSAARDEPPRSRKASTPDVDLSGLEQQLRQITARIEALRPSKELETAIDGLRTDLAEIGRSLTEALPRRAVESLEIEIKALGQRIDHSRATGADGTALAGLERGLAEVRETLQKLTPAESLVGFEEAVKGLAKKVDAIVVKEDPTALHQLEATIGALRGIVAHVASDAALAKVAEEVRGLAAKIDGLASSGPTLSVIENRINSLAAAVKASNEAGHAVPRELEKLLAGLIEKLEWVQLTQTDHTALAHLEDRIAALVKRLDASDSRLGQLEGIERGLADLLVHIDQLRGTKAEGEGVARKPPVVAAIEQEVARTQDSLEAVQGTVEHVVDRLAMLESDIRGDRVKAGPAEPPPPAPKPKPTLVAPPEQEPMAAAVGDVFSPAAPARPAAPESEPASPSRRLAIARMPIDPNLPPDHPLEPGSAAGRSRNQPSAAARIAASEAAVGSKPPVIPDPGGGKSDFIAAARRAAKAAALLEPPAKAAAQGAAAVPVPAKKMSERMRTLIVAAAVVVIVIGGFRIVSRLFEDGGGTPAPMQSTPPRLPAEPSRSHIEPPQVQTEPAPAQPPLELQPKPLESASPPADAVPERNPANPPASIPLPPAGTSEPPRAGLMLPPGWMSDTASGKGPDRRFPSDDGGWPAALLGASPDKAAGGAATAPAPRWSAPDITGSLPRAAAPRPATTAPAPAIAAGETLPAAIGALALRAAALAGDPAAAYEVGVRFAEGRVVPQNYEEAVRWLDRAARKGLAPAQFRVGSLYEKGLGVKKDLVVARDFYRAAADQGHGKAMHNLAVLYAEGTDGAADYRTAAYWFQKAADHGITDSQYNLAVLYARGIGVEQNLAESFKWFFLAAKEGDQDAAAKCRDVAARLDEQALSAARIEVETWKPLPQPTDAITVKKGSWDSPGETSLVRHKSTPTAKVSTPDAAKVN
jgi:localization factor PodJL